MTALSPLRVAWSSSTRLPATPPCWLCSRTRTTSVCPAQSNKLSQKVCHKKFVTRSLSQKVCHRMSQNVIQLAQRNATETVTKPVTKRCHTCMLCHDAGSHTGGHRCSYSRRQTCAGVPNTSVSDLQPCSSSSVRGLWFSTPGELCNCNDLEDLWGATARVTDACIPLAAWDWDTSGLMDTATHRGFVSGRPIERLGPTTHRSLLKCG